MKPRQPSKKTIAKNFPNGDARYVRHLLTDDTTVENDESVKQRINQCYHRPSMDELRAHALNSALDMHGVEYAYGKRPFYYLNTGYSYGVTLVKYHDSRSWFVSSWSDIVERGGY